MNTWPPKPGFTDITRTKSTSAAISLDRGDRRRRVQHDAGLGAELLDLRDRAMQVREHLDMHGHHVRARVDERLDVAIGVRDHQVDIERQLGRLAQRLHDRHANRDVGNEVAVHHVDVHLVGAAARGGGDLGAEIREVSGENRRSEANHRLTSSAMASPGCT